MIKINDDTKNYILKYSTLYTGLKKIDKSHNKYSNTSTSDYDETLSVLKRKTKETIEKLKSSLRIYYQVKKIGIMNH